MSVSSKLKAYQNKMNKKQAERDKEKKMNKQLTKLKKKGKRNFSEKKKVGGYTGGLLEMKQQQVANKNVVGKFNRARHGIITNTDEEEEVYKTKFWKNKK